MLAGESSYFPFVAILKTGNIAACLCLQGKINRHLSGLKFVNKNGYANDIPMPMITG